jgi:hypothetical protein
MTRYVIYNPSTKTYVKIDRGGWIDGKVVEAVPSYRTQKIAKEKAGVFPSLNNAEIHQIQKTVTVMKRFVA